MRRIELEVEHHIDGRFVGRHHIKSTADLPTIGTSRDATIRLLGEKVSVFHAALQFEEDHWVLCDLQSEHGTWVRKKPIVEHAMKNTTIVQIGNHVLKFYPKEINPEIFSDGDASSLERAKVHHQVVVRKAGFVLNTHLLGPGEPFVFHAEGKDHEFAAPKDHKWIKHEFGDLEVHHRLTSADIIEQSNKEKIQSFMDPSLKRPMAGAMVLLMLIFSVIFLAPDKSLDEMEEIKKPKQNKYTKILFDANTARKQKAKSQSISSNINKNLEKQSSAQAKPITGKKKKVSKKVVKVVNKLKKSGLTKMIGRISKRSINTAKLIQTQGMRSTARSMNRSVASVGSATAVTKIGKTEKNFRVGGVATNGKASGKSGYKGAAGLSLGGIGSSSVGILEEETVIQGGLSKDVIASVIKSYLGQIRYCYERQLSVSPELYGKVLVKFVIGGDGGVNTQAIGSSTLNNNMVEGCVLRRVSRWKFPSPKGGTQVKVSYPFLFKSTN